jgi:hypothetical protein
MGSTKKALPMFANTLTLTINAVAKVMTRTNQDNFGSQYSFAAADGSEIIKMQIRHSVDKQKDGTSINRHNVFIERTLAPTLTVPSKYWSATYTLRDKDFSGPGDLDYLSQAVLVLMGTLDTGLTTGEN